ncbi:MAG: DoxX family protein [Patescibacteria group bacterium]
MKKGFQLFEGEQGKNVALLLLRIALGGVFLFHGIQKLMMMDGTVQFFASIGFAAWVAWLVAITEVTAGALMVLGALTNFAAWVMIIILIVAIIKVHLVNGFSVMNGGYEFQLFMILTALAVLHLGHGRYAICKCSSQDGRCL